MNNRIFYIVFCFILIVTLTCCFKSAYAIAGNFSQYSNFANSNETSSAKTLSHFNPAQFKNYTTNPTQTKYYQGGTSDSNIKNDEAAALSKSNGGQAIENTFSQDQEFTVNPKSPEIQRSQIMEKDSYDVTHGISDKYIQCHQKAQSNCHISYYQSQCTTSESAKLVCYLTPSVVIKTVPYQVAVQYKGGINPISDSTATITLPESGIIKSFYVNMRSGNKWICNEYYYATLNGTFLSFYAGQCGEYLGWMSYNAPTTSIHVQANQPVPLVIGGDPIRGGRWWGGNYVLSILVTRYKKVPEISVENSCSTIPAICSTSTSNCLEPGGSRTFDGIPVYQSCWRTEQDYSCGPPLDHSCDALINQGCSMNANKCTETFGSICIQYQDTMSCPKKECVNTDVVCGKHSFCMDGNCYQPKSSQNPNFGKDEAQFAAVTGAAGSSSNDQQSHLAFTGNGMNCSLAPIGFLNCCESNGWGKDIGLANCTAEEKQLGKARENGYAISVGEYCSKKILGICITHRRSFCVFPGLLAKDVQQQGRLSQLHIGFGDAKNPNCSGLSPAQLQQINFGNIDFSNLEQSLEKQSNFPSSSAVSQYISNKIKKEMGG